MPRFTKKTKIISFGRFRLISEVIFIAISLCCINIIEHEMWIYDRWGIQIYSTGKTSDPESAKAWDGILKGSDIPVQNDVYVWVVDLTDINGEMHHLTGRVTVVE